MNKPTAYISKGGILFKDLPPQPMDLEPLYTEKQLKEAFNAGIESEQAMQALVDIGQKITK